MAYGEKYRDLPFDERFGDFPQDERQMAIQRLIEEFEKQRQEEMRQAPLERTWPYGYVRI